MHKLKRKVFLTLFAVLFLLAAVLTFLMDYREYAVQRDTLQAQMVSINAAVDRFPVMDSYSGFYKSHRDGTLLENEQDDAQEQEDEDQDSHDLDHSGLFGTYGEQSDDAQDGPHVVMVSEYPIYTIFVSRSGDFVRLMYFNTDGADAMTIMQKANTILDTALPGQMHIGNLFTQSYVWYYGGPNVLTIMDVGGLSRELWSMLGLSVLAFAAELAVIFYLCYRLTKWMTAPIEAAFEKQKQFIADASHELKTPLAVMMASAEAMEKDGNSKWLKNIESEADRMNALIKSLLDLTKSEQEELVLRRVDLSFLAEKEIMIQEAVSFEKGIELESQIPENVEVMGQSEMIEKVLEILLDNALCHARSRILVSLETKGSAAILRVENNGDGIPVEERTKIFERFYRSDTSRSRQENRYGLGLAIAKNLMSRMDGDIGVEERNGMTSFYIKLKTAPA